MLILLNLNKLINKIYLLLYFIDLLDIKIAICFKFLFYLSKGGIFTV